MAKRYKIGYTDGVYDLFHTGHLNMIETAKSQCEHLIVGVHGDDVVEGYKHRRPKYEYTSYKAEPTTCQK